MEAYTGFAEVYDLFMDNVPYEEWTKYLIRLLQGEDIKDGLILDLGCGTGEITGRLADAGYDMIGVDLSEEMLETAMKKQKEPGKILYLCQDMREFELYGTVRAIVSICDSMNYMIDEADLLTVFRLVNNYLDPGGLFVFDMNTEYKYRELLGETTISENREEGSFIWDNYYDEESGINEYDMTFFVKEESGLYRKYEETHFQKAYSKELVVKLLKEAGLEFVRVIDSDTKGEPRENSERLCFVAREHGK